VLKPADVWMTVCCGNRGPGTRPRCKSLDQVRSAEGSGVAPIAEDCVLRGTHHLRFDVASGRPSDPLMSEVSSQTENRAPIVQRMHCQRLAPTHYARCSCRSERTRVGAAVARAIVTLLIKDRLGFTAGALHGVAAQSRAEQ
jgi:hypothetical protein